MSPIFGPKSAMPTTGSTTGLTGRIDRIDDRINHLELSMNSQEVSMNNLERSMNASFDLAHQTMSTNLAILLEAIKALKTTDRA